MNIERIEEIKEKIEEAKSSKSKALGIIEQIESKWKEEYGVSSLEEAVSLLEKYKTQIQTLTKKSNDLEEKLEKKMEELDL